MTAADEIRQAAQPSPIAVRSRHTVERMWSEAQVQADIAADKHSQVSIMAAEIEAAAHVLDRLRADFRQIQEDAQDAAAQCDDLRALVTTVCAQMGWPLPGAATAGGEADEPGLVRTRADGMAALINASTAVEEAGQ